MIKIGVLGAGHIGKIHLRLLKEIPDFEIIGFYDPDEEKAKQAAEEFDIPALGSTKEVVDNADAVDIVTPTLSHYTAAAHAIRKGRHVFIEKPMTNTLRQGRSLMQLVEKQKVVAQVGHVERFNPAFVAARGFGLKPRFVEAHRLAEFNQRGTDVSVVLDLMIHDLDIVLHLIDAPVRSVKASGVAVLSDTPDIASARVEFANGAVANLTASRVSMKKMRKMRLFQPQSYVTLDFLNRDVSFIQIKDVQKGQEPQGLLIDTSREGERKEVTFLQPPVPQVNAIQHELESFAASILHGNPVAIPVEDGFETLKLAHRILRVIEKNNQE